MKYFGRSKLKAQLEEAKSLPRGSRPPLIQLLADNYLYVIDKYGHLPRNEQVSMIEKLHELTYSTLEEAYKIDIFIVEIANELTNHPVLDENSTLIMASWMDEDFLVHPHEYWCIITD